MVVGMLLAGGVGQRMGANVPKQFLEVEGKPIIIYPLEIMENHRLIDAVEVVCVKDYIELVWEYVEKYNLKKVKWVVAGGASCQESTRSGLNNLKEHCSTDDIVLIHMSSYPLANTEIMTGCIEKAKESGNGCTARPILYSVYFTDDRKTTTEQIDRDKLMLCTVPYAFNFGEVSELYDRAYAEAKGINGNVFTNTLYCEYGKRVYFTQDSNTNIKVTTPEDIELLTTFLRVIQKKKN
jgi:2-C-methyl-D-erythritol 4-phosphate cytidylyltransferase